MGQKRKRLALSCVDCRRRKVKCDRSYPSCMRCQKGGYGDKCLYVSYTGEESTSTGLPTPEDERRRQSRGESQQSWDAEAEQYEDTAHYNEVRHHNAPASESASKLPRNADPTALPKPELADTRIAQLHGRLVDLETTVYAAGGKPTSHEMNMGLLNPIGPGANRARNPYSDHYALADHEKVLLRGKSFKTQYFGPSNTLAILLQFEDLSKFVREILMTLPSLQSAKQAISKIREKEKQASRQHYDVSIGTLAAMVPDRAYADRLLYAYLDTIETTYRILHVPSFLKDYESFWESPKDARSEFVVQLLVAMSCVMTFVPGGEEGFVGRSSAKRETASHWINVCSDWLDSQSQKHVSLVNYQLQVQLWLSRLINTIKVKRFWTESGGLVRKFMAAGMHREPSLLSSRINTFDCEMRRRLWYTALELDMQATLDRGMTPTIGPLDWDTRPPSNIDDEDFGEDTEDLPESKPRGTFTRTSWLAWATETLPLRIEMLYKINSIRNTLDLDTVMEYDHKVRKTMDEIPLEGWRKYAFEMAPSPEPPEIVRNTRSPFKPSSLVTMVLSQAILNEFITILHQPYAVDDAFKSLHFQSRVARRYATASTITMYNPKLSVADTTGENTLDPRLHLNEIQRLYFEFMREDYVRGALSLAHSFAVSASPSSNPFRLHVAPDNHVIAMIQTVVDMLDDRVRRLGQGFHGYWITSSALSFVHCKQSPTVPRSTFVRAAADRVVKLHGAVMDGQLPRARRMMLPMVDHTVPTISATPDSIDPNATVGQPGSNETETLISIDGVLGLQSARDKAAQNSTPLYDLSGEVGMGNGDVGLGFDQTDPVQDMMFGLENMDWNTLMNTDPTLFMGGAWDYAS